MASDNGAGPPAGSDSDSPYATQVRPPSSNENALKERLGTPKLDQFKTDHPAWQPPQDPLSKAKKSDTRIVYRDLPIIAALTDWSVQGMREALASHSIGIFYASADLADAILGDDRVQATLGSLISGLFGHEVIFEPANDSIAAREVLDAWVDCWPRWATPAVFSELEAYSTLMGFESAQIVWDTEKPIWCPHIKPWHPRYEYYHWDLRRYIAISQNGQIPIVPGDGKWLLHAPFGEYRGWIRGAIRAVAQPWLMRQWAFRDWARYSEKHGIPIVKAFAPAASAEDQRDAFEAALAQLGSESTILLNRGVDGANSYDVEYAEPTDDSWQSFPGLIDRCDMSIVLALMFQNLTTEVKGGSFAATSSHMDIREGQLEFKDASWRTTLRRDVARPFAWLNFGDPELAPKSRWNLPRLSERAAAADAFVKFSTAIEVLARGGIEFMRGEDLQRFAADRFGIKGLPSLVIGKPPSGAGGGGFGK